MFVPQIAVPLATFTGWNLYRAPYPEGELCDRDGSYQPCFERTFERRDHREQQVRVRLVNVGGQIDVAQLFVGGEGAPHADIAGVVGRAVVPGLVAGREAPLQEAVEPVVAELPVVPPEAGVGLVAARAAPAHAAKRAIVGIM